MDNQVYLALYKGRKKGWKPAALLARLSDWLTRKLTRGIYSHCEIAIKQQILNSGKHYDFEEFFECYSSSIRDGGVRQKIIDLNSGNWDLIPIDNVHPSQIEAFYQLTKGKKYDWLGALGVVLKFRQAKSKYFCSEWCAAALGLDKPSSYSPNSLARLLRGINDQKRQQKTFRNDF